MAEYAFGVIFLVASVLSLPRKAVYTFRAVLQP